MRLSTFSVVFTPALAACHTVLAEPRPASAPAAVATPVVTASPSYQSEAQAPTPRSTSPSQENLDLRQVIPANNANPDAATLPTPAGISSAPVGGVSVTVMWIETWIGGTSQTWIPKTVTVQFAAVPDQGSHWGIGEVGMGTLTGEPGHTKTVAVGAAATRGPEWKRGAMVAAGVGIGFAGLMG